MDQRKLDRRAFLRHGLRGFLEELAESVRSTLPPPPELRRLRPPGALPESAFLHHCTRSGECLSACPASAIVRVPEGAADSGTPVIVPDSRACVLCSDLACTRVCPSGALRPLEDPREVAIGLARIDPQTCFAWRGTFCTTCVSLCPTLPKAITVDPGMRPEIDAERCTGCGLCEERCPTSPRAVRVLPPSAPPPSGSPSPTLRGNDEGPA